MYPQVVKKWLEIAQRTDSNPLCRFRRGTDVENIRKSWFKTVSYNQTIDLLEHLWCLRPF